MLRHGLHSLSKTFLSPIQTQPVIGAIGGATLGGIISPQCALIGAIIGFFSMLFLAISEEVELRMKQYRLKMRKEYVDAEKATITAMTQEVSSRVSAEIKEELVKERLELKTYVTELATIYRAGEKRVSIYDEHGDEIVATLVGLPKKYIINKADFTIIEWKDNLDLHHTFNESQESDTVNALPTTYPPTK